MSLNKLVVQGRIPTFDNAFKIFNEGDEKKAVLSGSISVRRNFKKADEQYYPEDLLDFKAFGAQANFMNQYFGQGSNIILEGELRRNENYEKDGQTVYGQMYIHVTGVHFQQGNKDEGANGSGEKKSTSKSAAPKPSTKKSTNPLAGKRQSIL